MRPQNLALRAIKTSFSCQLLLVVAVSSLVAGCMNPYYQGYGYNAYGNGGYQAPYGQQGYSPNPLGAPGTYVVPEGQGLYNPGVSSGTPSTYENDPPNDNFSPSDGSFFSPNGEAPVPNPVPLNSRDRELRGSGVRSGTFAPNGIQLVSGEQPLAGSLGELPPEFGYDVADYTSLRGIVNYDASLSLIHI